MEGRDQSITGTAAYSVLEGVTPMLYGFVLENLCISSMYKHVHW
jgi:hypothetical protein